VAADHVLEPILVGLVVLGTLLYLSLPLVAHVAMDVAREHDAAVPTMYIPPVWRAALTQAALTPTAQLMRLP
jgi:hypothetical protein